MANFVRKEFQTITNFLASIIKVNLYIKAKPFFKESSKKSKWEEKKLTKITFVLDLFAHNCYIIVILQLEEDILEEKESI